MVHKLLLNFETNLHKENENERFVFGKKDSTCPPFCSFPCTLEICQQKIYLIYLTLIIVNIIYRTAEATDTEDWISASTFFLDQQVTTVSYIMSIKCDSYCLSDRDGNGEMY